MYNVVRWGHVVPSLIDPPKPRSIQLNREVLCDVEYARRLTRDRECAASAAGILAGRHYQHPVRVRRRLQWAGEDHFRRGRSASIGFSAKFLAPEDRKAGEIFREVEPEDLLKYGLIPEFVGRLPVVATLEDLDEPSLKLILTQPKNALVKQYQRLFEMESIDLTLAEEALGAIARKAIDRKTGARGLSSIMEGILLDTMFDLPSLEGVEDVVISKEVVEGTARPLYIYADRADRAGDASAS
jgi:hypothetical protein